MCNTCGKKRNQLKQAAVADGINTVLFKNLKVVPVNVTGVSGKVYSFEKYGDIVAIDVKDAAAMKRLRYLEQIN
jgi:hypothetical protein